MLRNTVIASSGARHGRTLPIVLNFLEMEAAHRRLAFAVPRNVQAMTACAVTKEPSLLLVPGAATHGARFRIEAAAVRVVAASSGARLGHVGGSQVVLGHGESKAGGLRSIARRGQWRGGPPGDAGGGGEVSH
uniref:Uncharacterized protein n=1 Tax=Arundo donax TaxID=35708 RepID=A0A0A9DFM4_ARUDO